MDPGVITGVEDSLVARCCSVLAILRIRWTGERLCGRTVVVFKSITWLLNFVCALEKKYCS